MKEKEMKKLDEKSEEKISGGTKPLKDFIDPKVLTLKYGAPCIGIPKIPTELLKPVEPVKQPEQPAEPLAPAKPVEPEASKK